MQNEYNWYILYTRTNAEDRAMSGINEAFRKRRLGYHFEPFCPETEFYYRSKQAELNGTSYRKRRLFPNYVFIETDMPEQEFIDSFQNFILASSDIIRLLRYSEKNIALREEEKMRLEALLDSSRVLRRSVGKLIHNSVVVDNGPLKGNENFITRINRHNRAATLSIDMFYGKISATVSLEITEKVA